MTSNVRELLMDVAEVLYAERGLEGVPTREIAIRAGQRNSSVVQYHFGSRNGLVFAIFERRVQQLDAERLARLQKLEAQGPVTEIRPVVAAYVGAFGDFIANAGPTTHYARFTLQARASLSFVTEMVGKLGKSTASELKLRTHLVRLLPHLPVEVAQQRITLASFMMIAEMADYEYRREHDPEHPGASLPARLNNSIDMIVGALTAPITPL